MDHYDVIIVGGGPAGSAAGCVLAKGGKSVLIIDKEKFPRKKLCGGMVTEKTIGLLSEMYGEFDYQKVVDSSYGSFGIYHSKIGKVCKYSHPTRKTHFVHRVVFDNYLLNKAKDAGCQTLEAEKVLNVAQMSQLEYRVATKSGKEFSCNYIIGADGANSVVRKSVTQKTTASRYTIAIEAEVAYEDLKCFGENEQPFPQIYFGCVDHGYGWVFPKKDFVVVGVGGVVCKNSDNFKDIFDVFLRNLLKDNVDIKKYVISGFPVPFHNFIGNVSKNGMYLVGDAAGFVEPITGEGIYYAILSGKCVAESILNKKNDYARVVNDKISKHLRQANIVKVLFFCKPIFSYAMKKMKSNAKYCKYYFDVLAGEIDYFGYTKAIIKDRKKYYSE